MKTRKYKHGLSLVETLIVLAVIAMLAAMVIGIVGLIETQAKEKGVKSIFAVLEGELEEYKEFYGDFPGNTGELYSIPDCRKIPLIPIACEYETSRPARIQAHGQHLYQQ